MRYQILDSEGNIENIIEADPMYIAAFYPERHRLVPDETTSEIVVAEPVLILKTAFVNRFTTEEWASVTNSTDEDVIAFKEKIAPLLKINLTATHTRHDLEMLVDKGILTEARKDSILNPTVIAETEAP